MALAMKSTPTPDAQQRITRRNQHTTGILNRRTLSRMATRSLCRRCRHPRVDMSTSILWMIVVGLVGQNRRLGLVEATILVPLSTAAVFPPRFLKINKKSTAEKDEQRNSHDLQRGVELPNPVRQQDLIRIYKKLRDDYQSKAFGRKDWKLLKDKNDVQVSLLQHSASDPTCPYVKMRTVLPVSVEACWDFLSLDNWPRTMPKMDPYYEGLTIFQQYESPDIDVIFCRKRTKRLLTFGKREFVILSVSQNKPLDKQGTRVSGTVSVLSKKIPRDPNYTRAFQDSIAFYKPIDNNTKTDLTIVCRIDLNDSVSGAGGFIPMWLYVKTIGYTAVQSMNLMKKALLEDAQEQ